MYSIAVYIPKSHLKQVKQAIFDAGGGSIGNYSHCCFEINGKGQFKSNDNAIPSIGNKNELSIVDEVKIEFVCNELNIKKVIKNMKIAHPYEEVAYHIVKLIDIDE